MSAKSESQSMLVRSEHLDRLLNLAGEVIITSSNLNLFQRTLQAHFDRDEAVSQEVLESIKDLSGTAFEISSNLHGLVQSIRTVDLKDIAFRSRRLVRDVARKSGKNIKFAITGEDTVVDKSIVEQLFDPIAHQLRNAVDHGIELPQTRTAAGKAEEGSLNLRFRNTDHETVIEIEDDGAGIDFEALRALGIELGLITPSTNLTPEIALEIMWTPGVSTSRTVTDTSGRGVGMDVVRDRLERLGGSVSFTSEPGKGTSFEFKIPLVSAVNIVDALVVGTRDLAYAFPISTVVTTLSITEDQISHPLDKGRMIKHLNELIPLFDLDEVLLGVEQDLDSEKIPVIVLENKGRKFAYTITEFMSPQKLVIIPMDDTLDVPVFSGATILGGKQLGFIVSVAMLFDLTLGRKIGRDDRLARDSRYLGALRTGDSNDVALQMPGVEKAKSSLDSFGAVPFPASGEVPGKQETDESADFVMEITRMIPSMNEAVFSLETDPEDSGNMNSAFRIFHTIKGNLIMIGLPRAGETVHRVESVLDLARAGKLKISPRIIDLLMDAVSYIEDAVRAASNGNLEDPGNDSILERCSELTLFEAQNNAALINVARDEVILTPEARFRLVIHRKARTPRYQALVEFEPGGQSAPLVAFLIYRRFCDTGDVLGTLPTLADLQMGIEENKLKLFLASKLPEEKLRESLEPLLRAHYGATSFSIGRYD